MRSNRLLQAALAIVLTSVALAGCVTQVSEDIRTSCGGAAAMTAPAPDEPATVEAEEVLLELDILQPGGEPLRLGTLLPLTGSLTVFGPGMQQGAELAVQQINDAGGVNGQPVVLVNEDSKTDKTQAPNAFNNLVNQDVVGVVGAASSGVTGSILDLAMTNEVMVISPASTSPALTLERDNEGWFARVPPSDALQGRVLADLVFQDGCRSVNVLYVNNPYGVGLGSVFEATFESLGGTVDKQVAFEEGGTTFSSQVQQAAGADALVVIGYPTEAVQIVKEAFQKGIMADSVVFFSEGVKDPDFVTGVGKTSSGAFVLAGLRGTAPDAAGTAAADAFEAAYMDAYGEEPGLFAAETYDAIWGMALSAAYAKDSTGVAIKDNLRTVWNAPGIMVSGADPTAALTAALAGTDINYVGASNDFDLDENGDPANGIYAFWQVGDDGSIMTTEAGIEAA